MELTVRVISTLRLLFITPGDNCSVSNSTDDDFTNNNSTDHNSIGLCNELRNLPLLRSSPDHTRADRVTGGAYKPACKTLG